MKSQCGPGAVGHKKAIDKVASEYRKYEAKNLSDVEESYLDQIKTLEEQAKKRR